VIVVVGSLALDTVKTPLGAKADVLGGSGAYFALAARLFSPVSLVAVIGRDFPDEHLDLLKREGVNLDAVETADGLSFRWGGEYGQDLNQRTTLFTHLNVFESFKPRLGAQLRHARFLFLANIDPDLQGEVLEQLDGPELVVCDTMNYWIGGKREELVRTLRKVDIVIINDGEARELAQEGNLWRAAKVILGLGPQVAVIKKGEHGAILVSRDQHFSAPSYPVEMVYDPTGAGDSFAGGFIGYLAESGARTPEHLRLAVVYGTVAASFSVERFSVEGLVGLTRADLDRRARELQELARFDLDSQV
jgi:sugar/nucleoside kinase (ribokinase family)